LQNTTKNDLQDIISGKSEVRYGTIIQTIADYLEKSTAASSEIKGTKQFKKQEKENLERFITEHNYWCEVDFSLYVSEGAEQRVYLKNSDHVLKLNDAIYYDKWRDYFINLLLHNYFFPDTAYQLIGFTKQDEILFAVVEQTYVENTEPTDLDKVKVFMKYNGFINTRNNDYHNEELGIILEDLHDENVLTKDGVLFFIDTVFYLTDNFEK
jgi:hypothetical protein